MKKLLSLLGIFTIIMLCSSCLAKNADSSEKISKTKISDSNVIHDSWENFCSAQDENSLTDFINKLSRFEAKTFKNNPKRKDFTKNQIDSCIKSANSIYPLLINKEENQAEIFKKIHIVDEYMLTYLQNKNFQLEETHKNFFAYFMYLFITIIIGSAILIFLNIQESHKKDKIIYSSEQFLRHSILTRKRILTRRILTLKRILIRKRILTHRIQRITQIILNAA